MRWSFGPSSRAGRHLPKLTGPKSCNGLWQISPPPSQSAFASDGDKQMTPPFSLLCKHPHCKKFHYRCIVIWGDYFMGTTLSSFAPEIQERKEKGIALDCVGLHRKKQADSHCFQNKMCVHSLSQIGFRMGPLWTRCQVRNFKNTHSHAALLFLSARLERIRAFKSIPKMKLKQRTEKNCDSGFSKGSSFPF